MAIEHPLDTPSISDRAAARNVVAWLREGGDLIVSGERGSVTVPRTIAQAVVALIEAYAEGATPLVASADAEVSTQRAAEILNLSRPTVVKFLDQGRIPFTTPGTHRRVRLTDLMAFKAALERDRREALDRLAALGQAAIERAREQGRLTDEMI
jgi:excisionase family DNA binding protein